MLTLPKEFTLRARRRHSNDVQESVSAIQLWQDTKGLDAQ
jgi:hypothetical protein